MSSPSSYAECHLLLAVMDDDAERMERLVSDMTPGERSTLVEQLDRMRAGVADGTFRNVRPHAPTSP